MTPRKKTYRVMLEASLWERKEFPNGDWTSKKIARKVISFEVQKPVARARFLDAICHRSQHETVGVDRATGERSTGGAAGETSDGYHTFNELYEHRHALFSVIVAKCGGWKSLCHDDGTMFDGWFIAGVYTPKGMATYHLPLAWWDRYRCPTVDRAPKWDGHTAQEVPERISALTNADAPAIEAQPPVKAE